MQQFSTIGGNSFPGVSFDYIGYTSASTTDTYVYKTGGASGQTVATVVVTWTTSGKTVLSSITVTREPKG